MTQDVESLRRTLTARLATLAAQVAQIEDAQREPLDDDFAEQAVAREDDEALDVIERSALAEMAAIRLALQRLEAGGYGICASCGRDIAPARLKALPTAMLCIGCAAGA